MSGTENWGSDETFGDSPEFLGNPNPEARHLVSSGGKKYQFLASLSIAASLASDVSENPRNAYDVYNDLYTELSTRNTRLPANSSRAGRDSKQLVKFIDTLAGTDSLRSLSDIAIASYLEDLKLAYRITATTEALEEGAAIVLPFPHDLAPGIKMKKHAPIWGVLTSYPNIPIDESESKVLDETTTASVVFPTYDKTIKMDILPDDLISVIAAENRTVSNGNTGFIVKCKVN